MGFWVQLLRLCETLQAAIYRGLGSSFTWAKSKGKNSRIGFDSCCLIITEVCLSALEESRTVCLDQPTVYPLTVPCYGHGPWIHCHVFSSILNGCTNCPNCNSLKNGQQPDLLSGKTKQPLAFLFYYNQRLSFKSFLFLVTWNTSCQRKTWGEREKEKGVGT